MRHMTSILMRGGRLSCVVALSLLAPPRAAPAAAQAPARCGCAAQLEALVAGTRANYAGFSDRTASDRDRVRHDEYVALLHEWAARTMGADCTRIARSYITYFGDRHLQVRSTAAGALESAVPGLRSAPRATNGALALAGDTAKEGDPIIGLWASTSGRTRLRIVAAAEPYDGEDRYALVITSPETAWQSGDVYATFVRDESRGVYHATWYGRGRHPQEWSAVVVDDTLLLSGFNGWHRIGSADESGPRARRDPLRPAFRPLATRAGVLTLPSMQVEYAAAVDSVVRENASALEVLDLLIIDVRGNQGGGDETYMPLLPLLYTDTIVTVAGSVLSAPPIIAFYERFLDTAQTGPVWVVEMLAAMRAAPGAHIPLPETRFVPDRIPSAPRAVAILTDAVGASSTETFLLKAVQSAKVLVFGQSTAGIVDYLNPAQHELGCGMTLQAPTIRRSLRLPTDAIDNRGIAPHVALPPGERDPIGAILAHYGLSPTM